MRIKNMRIMNNTFTVDYDKKTLVVLFKEEEFSFNLEDGDVGDFWHSFTMKDGTIKDINFSQEDFDLHAYLSVFGVNRNEDGVLEIDTSDEVSFEDGYQTVGDPLNYFDWDRTVPEEAPKNPKIVVNFTDSDVQGMLSYIGGEVAHEFAIWTFTTDKGENIDVVITIGEDDI